MIVTYNNQTLMIMVFVGKMSRVLNLLLRLGDVKVIFQFTECVCLQVCVEVLKIDIHGVKRNIKY